ncbi:T-complex protein 1, beta subunit [Dictyocaulus viviparus]|uniref:T-complex protein 1 subunit beta n=1 Tax=Dictyocaulus viviparus TaxID=29172 RepID=A0A0D8XLK0_DICVI|nr:T-complex protein 1, beta subunit [Dictyocaulus viviparus]
MLPVQILKENAQEERGASARLSSFVGAIAIGDLVKSTLGPKGMVRFVVWCRTDPLLLDSQLCQFKDKILISGSGEYQGIKITNDGATILKSIGVDNPAAKVLVDMSMTQDSEVGDGTTSVAVLAAELLKEAEKLIAQRIHPQTIISGYRRALSIAQNALRASCVESRENMNENLLKIARTTLGSKILNQHKEHFAKLAVDAVLRLKGSGNLDAIQIIKKLGGSMDESYLDNEKLPGIYQPKRMEKAKIIIANTPMDTDKVKVFGSRVRVDSVAKVAELEAAEKLKMKEKVDKILAHKANVFINRQLIYNYPEQLFADAGVMAIEHADFEGIERLALVLGGEIISTFDTPENVKFGSCDLIEEVMIGEDRLLRFSGVPLGSYIVFNVSEACSIVLRGSTQQILEEAERSMHDAICVLVTHVRESRSVAGAGASEILMSTAVVLESQKVLHAQMVAGKEALAVESFGRALAQLPTIICDNAGLDSADLVTKLRAEHSNGRHNMGIDIEHGCVADVIALGVVESFSVKMCMVSSAAEAAEQILRVDDIIKCAPRSRGPDNRRC